MREPKPYPTCDAKNRQGEPCQRPRLKGKRRCRLHGGKSLESNKLATKHGIYTQSLTDEERAMFPEIEIGNVDNEIRMAKIMLNRALIMHAEVRRNPNDPKNLTGFELTEITRTSKGGGKTDISSTQKRPDGIAIIDRFMGRIASLEKTRAELVASATQNVDNPAEKAIEIAEALRAMIRTEADIDPDAMQDGSE